MKQRATTASGRWKRIRTLFFAVLERPPGERTAFLDEACAGDPELHREIAVLVESHEGDQPLAIERRLLDDGADTVALSDPLVGSHIGPYRILRSIAQGGMGDVYLAERDDDQYRQQVALKLVRLGLHTTEVVRRFRGERQILARLVHPHICRLLDGGVTGDGRPYLVMEHVAGEPITRYCDRHRLPIDDRLRLFRSVCSAVQFAHRNLVVHRDVKPSNVLVTERGEVKLLDFGIAKLLDHEATDVSILLTGTAGRLMTPEYAAPEQVRGAPITTATDVYALGVLLYELLTGLRPHRFASSAPAEIERVVCDEQPPWPSSVVTRRDPRTTAEDATEDPSSAEVWVVRRSDPARLQRKLRGDLDTIVMMALRKEPERRYGSAEQLAADIDRYLEDRPVIARRDTLGYRAGKFVRRNRAGVAVAAGVLALVLGFAAAMALQARELARQRDRASLEASTATRVTQFLEELFEAPDPFATSGEPGQTPPLDELLVRGAEKAQRELAGQPEVQARLLNVLGGVFRNLGDYEQARPLLEQAVEIQRQGRSDEVAAGGSEELAESLDDLAQLLLDLGEHDRVEVLLREAQSLAERGRHGNVLFTNLELRGHLAQERGELDAAEARYREAVELSRELFAERHHLVGASLANLATVLTRKADFDAAEPLLREALDIQRAALGPQHPQVATTMNNLAYLLLDKGEVDEAVALHRATVALRRELFDAPHPQIARSLNNLAVALQRRGDLEQASNYYRESLAMRRELFGDQHPAVASAINNLAAVSGRLGDHVAAQELLREAAAILRQEVGEDHPMFAMVTANLATNLHVQGDHEAAVALYRDALGIRSAKLPANHPSTATTRMDLGRCLTELGRYGEAEAHLHASFEVFESLRHEQTKAWTEALERLAKLYRARGEPEEAARFDAMRP